MRELGLLCGTFNPIHWGHLLIAECAHSQFQLSQVIFVTSGTPPHRHADLLDKENRHHMVEAAISGNQHFQANRLELDRSGPSYTIDTVEYFQKQWGPDYRLNLIVGADNLPLLQKWHRYPEIAQICRFLVAARPDSSPQITPEGADLQFIDLPVVGISSTQIRRRLKQGQSVLYMVPPQVDLILRQNHHYQQLSSNAESQT